MDINELLTDEAFAKQVKAMQSYDELAELLSFIGIPTTAAELHAALDPQEGELDEDDLDQVAGGARFLPTGPILPGSVIAKWLKELLKGKSSSSGSSGAGHSGGAGRHF